MSNPLKNDSVKAALEELGPVPYRLEQGRKSLKLRFGDQLQHLVVLGITPSDRRAALNARAEVRRQLRREGV